MTLYSKASFMYIVSFHFMLESMPCTYSTFICAPHLAELHRILYTHCWSARGPRGEAQGRFRTLSNTLVKGLFEG